MCSWLLGARLVSLLGMLVSGLCLVPVIIIHVTDRDHSLLVMPLLISLRVSSFFYLVTKSTKFDIQILRIYTNRSHYIMDDVRFGDVAVFIVFLGHSIRSI